jgi:hypothetical protein
MHGKVMRNRLVSPDTGQGKWKREIASSVGFQHAGRHAGDFNSFYYMKNCLLCSLPAAFGQKPAFRLPHPLFRRTNLFLKPSRACLDAQNRMSFFNFSLH